MKPPHATLELGMLATARLWRTVPCLRTPHAKKVPLCSQRGATHHPFNFEIELIPADPILMMSLTEFPLIQAVLRLQDLESLSFKTYEIVDQMDHVCGETSHILLVR